MLCSSVHSTSLTDTCNLCPLRIKRTCSSDVHAHISGNDPQDMSEDARVGPSPCSHCPVYCAIALSAFWLRRTQTMVGWLFLLHLVVPDALPHSISVVVDFAYTTSCTLAFDLYYWRGCGFDESLSNDEHRKLKGVYPQGHAFLIRASRSWN